MRRGVNNDFRYEQRLGFERKGGLYVWSSYCLLLDTLDFFGPRTSFVKMAMFFFFLLCLACMELLSRDVF